MYTTGWICPCVGFVMSVKNMSREINQVLELEAECKPYYNSICGKIFSTPVNSPQLTSKQKRNRLFFISQQCAVCKH